MNVFNSPFRRWRRGDGGNLSDHFSRSEFECTCGICANQFVAQALLDRLEKVRLEYNDPIYVTSGYRCELRQGQLRQSKEFETARGTSSHTMGYAADISGKNMARLLEIVSRVFVDKNVGVASTFLHVDIRDGGPRRWFYGRT